MSIDNQLNIQPLQSYPIFETFSPSLQRIPSHKWLVKYFELSNINGEWNEGQTGYVYLDNTLPSQPPPLLIMTKDEETNEIIFSFEITEYFEFKTQKDTILTWKSNEDEQQENLAISFLDKEGIEEIKECIEKIKGNNNTINKFNEDDDEDYFFNTINRNNLHIIADKIQPGMDFIFHKIISQNTFFFNQLCALFEEEEIKLEETKSSASKETNDLSEVQNDNTSYDKLMPITYLHLIFKIIKNAILTGDPDIIKQLLSDELYLTTFGAFEYDFESQKAWHHRQYFKEIVNFKNILEISDSEILGMIHLNHRLSYLRDTAMGRIIDENTSSVITNIIRQNDNDIIDYFINEKEYLHKLINHIGNDNDLIMQKNACDMLIELMEAVPKDIIKDQFKKTTDNIYSIICDYDILTILKRIIRKNSYVSNYQTYITQIIQNKNNENVNSNQHNKEELNSNSSSSFIVTNNNSKDFLKSIEEEIKISSIQILTNILTAEPSLIRDYIKNKDSTLFEDLCNLLLFHESYGIKWEIDQSIINPMIISENGIIPSLESDEYSKTFFDKGLITLLNYLSVPLTPQYKTEIVSTKQIILDIFIHYIESYGNNIEEWLLKHNVIYQVLQAINDKHKIINLYVVKFIKCLIIKTNETFYENNLYEILDKIMTMIKGRKNKNKGGILLSAICDLFLHLKVLKTQKFTNWINERQDILYCEENSHIFTMIFEKGCEGIEKKIKENIINENRNFEDFFRGNDVDEDEFQGNLLIGKKTFPSQTLEQILNQKDEPYFEITNQKNNFP